jgi:type II secretory pathway pseudopilin PulG
MEPRSRSRQGGITLVGLIFVFAIVGMIAVLGIKVTPTVTEYLGIKKAIVSAKASGTTVLEIRNAFDRQADVGYIDAISSKDLEITKNKNGDGFDVSFAYQKKIPLFGPASLLLDYAGSTAPNAAQKESAEK